MEPPLIIIDGQEEYEVEEIMGKHGGRYNIKWVEYPKTTWEPRENLQNAQAKIQAFKRRTQKEAMRNN